MSIKPLHKSTIHKCGHSFWLLFIPVQPEKVINVIVDFNLKRSLI